MGYPYVHDLLSPSLNMSGNMVPALGIFDKYWGLNAPSPEDDIYPDLLRSYEKPYIYNGLVKGGQRFGRRNRKMV